ncbi:hypothetical protein D3C79_654330 [compost metagenome]
MQGRRGRITVLIDDGVLEVFGQITVHIGRGLITPRAGGEVETQLATCGCGNRCQLLIPIEHTIPAVGGRTDLDGLDITRAICTIGIIVPTAHDIVGTVEHIALHQTANDLIEQSVDQIAEVIHPQRGIVRACIHIDILQTGINDAIADPYGGDIDAVVIDEVVPTGRHRSSERGAARACLFVGIAITDEDHLIAPPRDRGIGDHCLLDGISKISITVEWTGTTGFLRVQRVHQIRERGDVVGWQIRN